MYHSTHTPLTPPRANSVIDHDARKLAEAIMGGVDADTAMAQYALLNELDHERALREIEEQEKGERHDQTQGK